MIVFILFISVSDRIAAEMWYVELCCMLFSHHLCGFCISYAVLGAQLGLPVPRHLHMTSRVPFRNAGRHSWYQSRVQSSAMMGGQPLNHRDTQTKIIISTDKDDFRHRLIY